MLYYNLLSEGLDIDVPVSIVTCHRLLLLFPQVRALKTLPEFAPVYQLLEIFAGGTLERYMAFYQAKQPTRLLLIAGLFATQLQANAPLLSKLGVGHEASLETMRMLTLCSAAAGRHAIPYDEVAAALQVRRWLRVGGLAC
jgi:hypothetical protein